MNMLLSNLVGFWIVCSFMYNCSAFSVVVHFYYKISKLIEFKNCLNKLVTFFYFLDRALSSNVEE
jgi:hypothetical protein